MSPRLAAARWGALLAILAAALLLRLPDLGARPMHGDEAVHAEKLRVLWSTGAYRYDHNEFHGPTIYYAAIPILKAAGVRSFSDFTEVHLRLGPALLGASAVLLVWLLVPSFGWVGALTAAALIAVSPSLAFYSRYFIQEIFLVFFMLTALGCGLRWRRTGAPGWLLGAGASAGLMLATKETSVIVFGAAAVAVALIEGRRALPGPAERRWLAAAAGVALIVACLFLSGFLTNPSGPVDFIRSFGPWGGRAGGTDLHRHPWYEYLRLLLWTHRARGPVWSELALVVPAIVGVIWAWRTKLDAAPGVRSARWLSLFGSVQLAAYSAIPYKTPWCILGVVAVMALLAGYGVRAALAGGGRWRRVLVAVTAAAAMSHLGWLAWLTCRPLCADPRSPWVYAQTAPELNSLVARVHEITRANPGGDQTIIQIVSADAYYWPLPWYLRRCPNIGYYTAPPPDPAAPVVLSSPEFDESLTRRLDPTHLMTGMYSLRPTVVLQLWVRLDYWGRFLETRPRPAPVPGEDDAVVPRQRLVAPPS